MKNKNILCITSIVLILSGCGNNANQEVNVAETEATTKIEIAAETEVATEAEIVTELEVPTDAISEFTEIRAEGLLDMFVAGEIAANYVADEYDPFYITDLPIDVEDFYSYSIGDRMDLDNDGENELIIEGPYGGKYLDARDGQIYVLDEGEGTALVLSYTQFDGKTWIVHSDTTHGGRIMYNFTLYDGDGQVVDEFELNKEFWETPDTPDGPKTVYTYRDEEITKDEYDELYEKMLGGT